MAGLAPPLVANVFSCGLPCTENDRYARARHYCVDCEMYFCKQCVKCHNTIPALRKHQLNDVNCSDSDSADDETIAQGSESVHSMRYNIHQGKLIDTYCEDHDEICCGLCVVVKHRPCTTKSIAVAANDFKSNPEVNKSKEQLTKLLVQLEQEKEKRTENLDHIDKQKLELIKNVDNFEEQIIAKVKSHAESSRKEIRSKFEEHKTALDNDVDALDAVITDTELQVNKLELMDDELLFGNVKMSKIMTKDVVSLLHDMAKDWRKKEIQFQFDKTVENLVEGMKSFGQLDKEVDSQEKHAVGICTLNSGDVLLAKVNERKLIRYDAYMQYKDKICLTGEPIAVYKLDEESVAVNILGTNDVEIVDVGRRMKITSSFTLEGNGQRMTYNAYTEEILACEEDKICVYSRYGEHLKTYCMNAHDEELYLM